MQGPHAARDQGRGRVIDEVAIGSRVRVRVKEGITSYDFTLHFL